MADRVEPVTCPFDFSESLDFDPLFRQLMALGPVVRVRLPYGEDAWLVTTFDGVKKVTTDPRYSRAAIVGLNYPRLTPEPIVSPESINVMDPPRSTRLRRLVTSAFTTHTVERMRPAVQRVVDDLLLRMAEHGPPLDIARHLSEPLPHHTICELLDIPSADRAELQHKTHQMLAIAPEARETSARAKADLRAYFTDLATARRRTPGSDLISTLATAHDRGDRLTDQELAVMAVTLILSGHDTASCQISNIVYVLLTNPQLTALLRDQPETLPRALEELLRIIPFRKGIGIPRVAMEDTELAGVPIRAGEFVHVSYLTANRDPAAFTSPDVLDPHRPPHPHMTFGWGGHRCLAAPLARTELEIAIRSLLDRFPRLALAVPADELRWDTRTIRRFPLELPVRW
ncbi:cytochrome P450 [Streptomyces sp. NPDC046261]|uniref:cytochrome P450 n=1 Tax=Streptomyces sp. NPDC046261 TaxID=3157200 RepID=UPI0033F50B12